MHISSFCYMLISVWNVFKLNKIQVTQFCFHDQSSLVLVGVPASWHVILNGWHLGVCVERSCFCDLVLKLHWWISSWKARIGNRPHPWKHTHTIVVVIFIVLLIFTRKGKGLIGQSCSIDHVALSLFSGEEEGQSARAVKLFHKPLYFYSGTLQEITLLRGHWVCDCLFSDVWCTDLSIEAQISSFNYFALDLFLLKMTLNEKYWK